MAFIARREDNRIILPYVVGGDLTIIHEAANGVLVVSRPRRKHWKKGYPEIPVRYQLARLLTGPEADEARIRTLCNSRGYAATPDVFVGFGFRVLLAEGHGAEADDADVEVGATEGAGFHDQALSFTRWVARRSSRRCTMGSSTRSIAFCICAPGTTKVFSRDMNAPGMEFTKWSMSSGAR